jgi:hypothetical protein
LRRRGGSDAGADGGAFLHAQRSAAQQGCRAWCQGCAAAAHGKGARHALPSVAGALLDFWQADGEGEYDNEGFRLRGHQFSDRSGRFALSTVVPGNYPGRTPHIHARVQPRDGKLLTTQLYFPGERGNEGDPLFDEALLLDLRAAGRGRRGRFDFVVA